MAIEHPNSSTMCIYWVTRWVIVHGLVAWGYKTGERSLASSTCRPTLYMYMVVRLDTEAKESTSFLRHQYKSPKVKSEDFVASAKDSRCYCLKCLTCLDFSMRLLSNILFVVA